MKRFLIGFLPLLMIVTLIGCGGRSGGASATASAVTADRVLTVEELETHELYNHLDDNALSGVTKPILASRAGIRKGLPVAQKKNLVVGWSEPTMSSAWFAGIQRGAVQYTREYGYELKFLVATDFDANKQSNDIEALITQGIDVLVLDAVDFQAQVVDVQKAVDAGIPVISLYAFQDEVPVVTTITANYYEQTFLAGEYAAKLFTSPIEMVMIPGQIGHPLSNSRVAAFLSGWIYAKQQMAGTAKPYRQDAQLEGYNGYLSLVRNGRLDLTGAYGVNVVGMANGGFNDVGGMAAAEDLLTAHPNIKLIFPDNDQEAAGAIKVLDQRGLTGQIQVVTGCDGDTSALTLVGEGKLGSTGYNNPLAITKAIVELIHKIFEESYDANNMPMITALPVSLFTGDTYMSIFDPNTEYGKILDVEFRTVDEVNAPGGAGR
jgi:ribose transport system substrate-binding protein